MKIQCWNVNGIRASAKKGFEKWFSAADADVVCLQEIKATPEQLDEFLLHPNRYHSYWHPAEKPGYSGVALYARREPDRVVHGLGIPDFDREGRVLTAEFGDIAVISAYFPNSQREHTRLGYKLEFCGAMLEHCRALVEKGKSIVLCGDYNIAHEEIDLKNPKSNRDNAGFLPEERAWMTKFLGSGFVDTFRHFEKGGGYYTWWSYRPGVREKNIGWRLDYHCVNDALMDRVKASHIHCDVVGSDHCPVELILRD
jgi:exodeoxyribonuclease-3